MTGRRWLALVVAIALGACGADKADVSDDARVELEPLVAEIRALADARQADQLHARLAELQLVVDDLLQRGELTQQGADEVRAAAASVASQLGLITTTTQPPPPDNDRDDDDRDEEGKEDKEDKEDKD